MNRHQSRMVAAQIIYEWSIRPKEDILKIASINIEHNPIDDIDENFVLELIKGVRKHYQKIDRQLNLFQLRKLILKMSYTISLG